MLLFNEFSIKAIFLYCLCLIYYVGFRYSIRCANWTGKRIDILSRIQNSCFMFFDTFFICELVRSQMLQYWQYRQRYVTR
nr:MAG TPA: Protein of unknown function (DUF3128) [Caudoviricetes sp.]